MKIHMLSLIQTYQSLSELIAEYFYFLNKSRNFSHDQLSFFKNNYQKKVLFVKEKSFQFIVEIENLEKKIVILKNSLVEQKNNIKKIDHFSKKILGKIKFYLIIANFYKSTKKLEKSLSLIREIKDRLSKYEEKKEKNIWAEFLFSNLNLFFLKPKDIKDKIKKNLLQVYKLISLSFLCTKEITQIYDIKKLSKTNILKEKRIYLHDIQKMDVLLSYKIQEGFLSFLISIAEQSRITHSSIVSSRKNGNIFHINPSPHDDHKIRVEKLILQEHEMLFVMRPKLHQEQKKRLRQILSKTEEGIKNKKTCIKFPEFKQWFATFEGLLYVINIFLRKKIIIFPNIFQQKNSYYCSEFIDSLFKKIHIFLVSRSEYDSIIGPSELLYSPYLEFVGVVYNDKEKRELRKKELKI